MFGKENWAEGWHLGAVGIKRVLIYLLNICCIRLASVYSDKEDRQSPEFKKYMFS